VGCHLLISRQEILGNVQVDISPLTNHLEGGLFLTRPINKHLRSI
jgi:hypothetical protein